MNIKTNSFKNNKIVDIKYSGYGKGTSPELEGSQLPEGTKSLALFAHDPDAPIASGFGHGQVVNIPTNVKGVKEGQGDSLPGIVKNNDYDAPGYTPPGPPKGTGVHRYNFTIYALPFEDINEVAKTMGKVITPESSRAITAFIVEMNKLDSATISFNDEFREK